mmetsp:Transcript_24111/g.43433  ORF Transcript_24111/g.43433 Transcript_24111/m.43433 type:complete len:600 (-) Transcript_24111:720-2519(-)|eukprot:CAMPEP_0201634742 /NCGR_PEP_ID=MMETSP0493-20130528/7550_1 /ASSEMBLY_ACC=CAM_ASM_000838 /TAXON_ID=420259 /ORGANISM="Thalassiosira gravida, Strain GMp14c1" /LENGTH=599 /DNA_ID=CAMNT_0048106625 /DNA_START=182 /DNA_END=1981 /DNA_ORIENTATION=+
MGRRRNKGRANKKRSTGNSKSSPRRFYEDDEWSNSSSEEISVDFDEPLAFDIGTRVELPNIKRASPPDENVSPNTGTVVGHWKRRDHWPEHLRAPYLVLLDDGMAVYCHRTDADFLRETDVPPMKATLNIGCRIECKIESKWFPGTIVQRHDDWVLSPIDTPPYFIRFDYGRERPFWGPEDRIRAISDCKKGSSARFPPLRFELGDRVVCSVDDDWAPGQVVRKWYTEEEFENGHAVPYQVLLDTGDFIYAPLDDDDCIKRSTAPPVPLRFDVGDRVTCKVEEGWTPGMVINTQYRDEGVHGGRIVPYEIKLDMGDIVYAPCDNDLFVKKKLRFEVGDRVECLADDGWMAGIVKETDYFENCRMAPYQVELDTGDDVFVNLDSDSHIKESSAPLVCRGEINGMVHVMSKMMIYNQEYGTAEKMLQERVTMIRSKIKSNVQHKHVNSWRVDMSNFLCYLSEVHQATGSLHEMRAALDEALELIEISQDKSKSHRLLNVTSKLATHAALTSDKYAALLFSEEAIILARETTGGHDSFRLGLMMFQCGKLNVACDDRERGLEQMSEGLEILTRLYGRDNKHIKLMAKDHLKTANAIFLEGEE